MNKVRSVIPAKAGIQNLMNEPGFRQITCPMVGRFLRNRRCCPARSENALYLP
jgi:hypothetical protein